MHYIFMPPTDRAPQHEVAKSTSLRCLIFSFREKLSLGGWQQQPRVGKQPKALLFGFIVALSLVVVAAASQWPPHSCKSFLFTLLAQVTEEKNELPD
jgi:hypothetical protein